MLLTHCISLTLILALLFIQQQVSGFATHFDLFPAIKQELKLDETHILGDEGNRVDTLVEPLVAEIREKFSKNYMVKLLATPQGKRGSTLLPLMAFFVNSFSDLNRMVLPYHENVESDPLKQAINQHCKEDSTHLYLLWQDLVHHENELEEAGLTSFLDTIKFMWNDKLYRTREVGYQVAKLAGIAVKPIHRYCMIRTIEEMGNVFFTTGVGYVMKSGVPSQYLGHDHLALEDGHLQNPENDDQENDDNEPSHDGSLANLFANSKFESMDDRVLAYEIMAISYQLFYKMLECLYENMGELNQCYVPHNVPVHLY